MVELLKEIVAPVLGIPLAVKFALNQINVPAWIGVPLKLDVLAEAGHDCGIACGANRKSAPATAASWFRKVCVITTEIGGNE
jgi:hypothetical protein